MNKIQAIDTFWNSFGVPAYDESTLDPDVEYPYITYDVKTDSFGNVVNLSASLWDRNTSWARVQQLSDKIARRLGERSWQIFKLDNGRMWLMPGVPFSQRMRDDDDMIRRIYINIQVEYLTQY